MRDKTINPSQAAQQIDVFAFLSYRDYLKSIYELVKRKSKPYSYLRFAEDLGFAPTNVMRLYIIGKRPLTLKSAQTVTTALGLIKERRRYFLTLVAYQNASESSEREVHFQKLMQLKTANMTVVLDQRLMQYFSQWYHPVLRELIGCHPGQFKIGDLNARIAFPLRLDTVKKAIALLKKLDFISEDAAGYLWTSDEHIKTDFEVDSLALAKFHQEMIGMAKESVTRIHESQREVNAVTVRLPLQDIEKIKRKMRDLMMEVLNMEKNSSSEDLHVMQLNAQIFPFTKVQR